MANQCREAFEKYFKKFLSATDNPESLNYDEDNERYYSDSTQELYEHYRAGWMDCVDAAISICLDVNIDNVNKYKFNPNIGSYDRYYYGVSAGSNDCLYEIQNKLGSFFPV